MDMTDPKLPSFLKERKLKGKVKGELNLIKKNGEKFIGLVSSPIYTDESGQEKTAILITDITNIKNAEKSLRK